MDQLQVALLQRTLSNDDGAGDTPSRTWHGVQGIVNVRRNTVHPCCHTLRT